MPRTGRVFSKDFTSKVVLEALGKEYYLNQLFSLMH